MDESLLPTSSAPAPRSAAATSLSALEELEDLDRSDPTDRAWTAERIRRLQADARRSADTHLHRLELPEAWGIDVYLKDESTHPTGSLKHRLARSLFLFALVNGWLRPGGLVVEASSGSTAVSEAHFARMLDLEFVAVVPRWTSAEKIQLIEAAGGRCHFVANADELREAATQLAREHGGHFMDQFAHAERATDWRGNNNIAESLLGQLAEERHPVPRWIVVGAGTGGTSATIGRHLRYHRLPTGLCVADVEASAFFSGWSNRDPGARCEGRNRIDGIGRPRVEPSFIPEVVDRMVRVPDIASVAATRFLSDRLGRRVGGSTGTNLIAVAKLVDEMRARGETGSIVTLICDSGERYAASYFDDAWVAEQGWDLGPWRQELERALPS